MTISRRKFLGRSSVLGVAALVPMTVRAVAPSSLAGGIDHLSRLTRDSFTANLNSTFEIQISALNSQQLVLTDVVSGAPSRECEPFVITLAGDGEPFKQGTYTMSHHRLGSFPLFLVPAGTSNKTVKYQAVFARLR